jgi:hypothetical protein
MATPTSYSANLVFGGRVDSTLDKAVGQIKSQLQSIQKDTRLFSENISSIGTGILAIGAGFLGLRVGLDALEDLADAGKNLADATNQVHVNLGKMVSLGGQTKAFESQLATFNLELRKTSGYATDIAVAFESGLTGQGFKSVSQIETLTRRFELLAASQNRKLTPEDAQAAAASMGTAVKTGGESGEQALEAMGLSLSWENRLKYRAIQNYPGMQGQAYTAREQFIEGLLQKQAPEGAFGAMGQRPQSAGYLLGQEQTEFAQKLGVGVNDLFAPVQQELTKALKQIEDSGDLEKFDTWAKGAGQRISDFFGKFIEPKLPSALDALVKGLDKFGDGIDRLSRHLDKIENAKNWLQNPNPEHKSFPERMGDFWHWGTGLLGGMNDDAASRIEKQKAKWNFNASVGSQSGHAVSSSSVYDSVPAFASGGIVTRPTIGLIGEKEPEGIFPLSFLGNDTKDLTKANTEATKKSTDALTTLTQKLDDNLSFLQQQNQFGLIQGFQGVGAIGGAGGGARGGSRAGGGSAIGAGRMSDLTGKDGSLAVEEEYDSEGHSSQFGPKGNRLITGWNYLGLHPDTMSKYGLSQGELVRTEEGWAKVQESASRKGTVEFHADYPGQFQNKHSRLHILETKKASDGESDGTSGTSHRPINVTYNITVHSTGHDTNSLVASMKEALRTHSEELGHHVKRALQEDYRNIQRTSYA